VRDRSNIEVKIAHIARRQQRNVTRAQLLSAGLASSSIAWRVKKGWLYPAFSGVYTVGAPPINPLEFAMAAVLACGPRAALSHGSALTLWGIWKRWDQPLEVTIAADRRPKGVRVHRVRTLDRREVTRHNGVPVTTLARTLLDMAKRMPPKSLTRAINDGRLNGHLHPAALLDVIERHPGHRGRGALEAVIGRLTERPTRSSFEDTFPAFCERYGLPAPQMNAIVCGYEVDALFEQERVIVELDGWAFHSSRASFEDDRKRDGVTLAAGFVTVRITRARYERDPGAEAAQLHEILARRMAA
jgi:hypothetical protein